MDIGITCASDIESLLHGSKGRQIVGQPEEIPSPQLSKKLRHPTGIGADVVLM
jgi:hypothetical protein